MKKVKANPHAIDGGVWRAESSVQPRVNISPHVGHSEERPREIFIPLGDDCRSQALRAHEYAHRAYSTPPCPPDLSHDVYNVVEDCRVNQRLLHDGGIKVLAEVGGITQPEAYGLADRMAAAGDFRSAVLFGIAGTCDKSGEHFLGRLRVADRKLAARVLRVVGAYRARIERQRRDPAAAEKIARDLAALLNMEAERERERARDRGPTDTAEAEAEADAVDEGLDELENNADNAELDERTRIEYGELPRKNSWGKLTVETPPCPVRASSAKVGRDYRAAESGTKIGKLRRFTTDRHIFKVKRPTPGGAVLFDCSGSMGNVWPAVHAVLDAAPAAKVGLYAGGIPNHSAGRLFVVARDGRKVAPDGPDGEMGIRARLGGCNVVDGPAIAWLAEQGAPRVWLSDGQVTGIGDSWPSAAMLREIVSTLRRARIQRVDTRDPKEILRALARGYRANGGALLAAQLERYTK